MSRERKTATYDLPGYATQSQCQADAQVSPAVSIEVSWDEGDKADALAAFKHGVVDMLARLGEHDE